MLESQEDERDQGEYAEPYVKIREFEKLTFREGDEGVQGT